MTTDQLSDENHDASVSEMLTSMVPPPRFSRVTLSNYEPNPSFPSQSRGKEEVERFADSVNSIPKVPPTLLGRLSNKLHAIALEPARGLYLDGGYGVGKTHLLAGLFTRVDGGKAYFTFADLTYFVGYLGFVRARQALGGLEFLAIDEFELDDPGDTVLISNLCDQLASGGVSLAVTSNTLPEKLGEGRFSASDFLRETQRLSRRFEVITLDGPDYRRRSFDFEISPMNENELPIWVQEEGGVLQSFTGLEGLLRETHPARYRSLLQGVTNLGLSDVCTIRDQEFALRFVAFVDRMYDEEIVIRYSGCKLREIFSQSYLEGGYRKKYGRALSRLASLLGSG